MTLKIILLLLAPFFSVAPQEDLKGEIDEPPTHTLPIPTKLQLEEKELVYGLVYDPGSIEEEEEEVQKTVQQVALTSFYDSNLGAGYNAYNFRTNGYEMTIDHDGYVVVATATNECLRSNSGGCENYNYVPNGFHVFSYGDTFEMYIEKYNITLKAKVYDSCGACFWNEAYQRVDIHTQGTKLGKIRGEVILP